jgi:hypothetical protein
VVPDVAAAAAELATHGVTLERYPGMPQDDDGIVRSTDPAQGRRSRGSATLPETCSR